MRFFVLCTSHASGVPPHIIAEVVRELPLEDDRSLSLASALSGSRSAIVTEPELLEDAEGRHALEMWDADDDGDFDRETEALSAVDVPESRHLRLVTEQDEPRALA